jgi:CRP/FNR family transcriptional regulator
MLTHSLAYTPLTTGAMPQTARAERHEPRSLQEHLAAAPLRKIEAKQNVFAEGDRSTHIYRVESGAISLHRIMPDGRRQILGFAYPGDVIGLGASELHRFNAQAIKPTQLRCLRRSLIDSVARVDPEFGQELFHALSLELAAAHDLLLTTGQRSATERIATFLLAMSRRNQRHKRSAVLIDLPMTRADIGDFLGITIETVSRTFTKLRQLDIIDLAQSTSVRILDIEELEQLAEGAQ